VRMCDIVALSLRKTKMLLTGRRRSEPDRYQTISEALSMLLRPLRT
jgi:hypothetical protein